MNPMSIITNKVKYVDVINILCALVYIHTNWHFKIKNKINSIPDKARSFSGAVVTTYLYFPQTRAIICLDTLPPLDFI